MKAELQLFLLASDRAAFIDYVKDHVDEVESGRFWVGDCEILFKSPEVINNTLFVSKLSLNSGGLDDGCKDSGRANAAFRTVRKWVKKNYDNRLCNWEAGAKEKMGRTRDQWLAPDAKAWVQSDEEAAMRFSEKSAVFFDIAPEFATIGGIVPKGEKFKARNKQ